MSFYREGSGIGTTFRTVKNFLDEVLVTTDRVKLPENTPGEYCIPNPDPYVTYIHLYLPDGFLTRAVIVKGDEKEGIALTKDTYQGYSFNAMVDYEGGDETTIPKITGEYDYYDHPAYDGLCDDPDVGDERMEMLVELDREYEK